MTLIIGIKCSNGIVMGADGCATLGAMGQHTVTQPINKKLEIILDSIVLGVSGPVGLGQRFKGVITKVWSGNRLSGKDTHEAMLILRRALWEHVKDELEAAAVAKNAIGNIALESALSQTLLIIPIAKSFRLIQFDQQCAPEEVTADIPFVSIGSGQKIADTFLAFLRRVFWPNKLPTIEEGVFATVWTLEHAIVTNPGGIKDPKQIVIYSKEFNQARELSQDQLKESVEVCYRAEHYLADFPKTFEEEAEAIVKEEEVKIPKPPDMPLVR